MRGDGGELAGHYYFRDFYCCDSGMLAALIAIQAFTEQKRNGGTVSALIDQLNPYANSGECNFRVDNKDTAMQAVRKYALQQGTPTASYDFDGYRIEFTDWWLNVRKSNTEPYLRLLVEANTTAQMERHLKALRCLIEEC